MDVRLQGSFGSYSFDPESAEARLGQGGMGVVFRGTHVETGNIVAIKVMYKEIAPNFQAVERERQSANIRIHHKNLIQMLDFIEQGGIFHIVSEFVQGKTLHDYLLELQAKNQFIDPAEAVLIINQVMNGLEALHKNIPPIIHRDIDPSNIMICEDGTVKIMDFGIAKISDGKRKSLTGMGTVIGKPHYSPPEQIRGENDRITPATDIYALGITFYEMFTGNPPFNASNEYDVMKMQIEKPLPVNAHIPHEIFKIIQKATEKQQARRFQSVNDFRYALNSVETKQPGSVLTQTEVEIWKKRALIAGAAATIFLFAFLWGFIKHGSSSYTSVYNDLHPITITKMELINTDRDSRQLGNDVNSFAKRSVQFIAPRITFTSNIKGGRTISLLYKYINPGGNLIYNSNNISVTYTLESQLNIPNDDKEMDASLRGYGLGGDTYTAGTYTCEIWYADQKLASKNFEIKGQGYTNIPAKTNNWLKSIFK